MMKLVVGQTLVTYLTGDDREVETGTFLTAFGPVGLYVKSPAGKTVFLYEDAVLALQNGSYRREFATVDEAIARQMQVVDVDGE